MKRDSRLMKMMFWLLQCTLIVASAFAQTTAFKYQGSLTDTGSPANGSFQMSFRLFDAFSGGTQVGSTITDVPTTATNGVFTVTLDFGSAALSGANRWLEISVRRNSGESYVTLSPREPITSSPYSVRTLSAAMADDSQKLGGVNANQFVQTNDSRLTDARNPLPGSTSYIQNQNAAPQAVANFNISGNGSLTDLNVLGSFTASGIAPPAVAPAGKTRFYFDTATNKLRVSENGGAYVNLVGATGVSGSGTVNRIPFFSAATTLGDSNIFQAGTNIGIGTPTPGSGFELRGTGLNAQQRITDSVSGNSLVLQGGPGNGMKVTGYNYGTGTAQPLYLGTDGANTFINSGGGFLGIGTTTPSPFYRIDTAGSVRAIANTHVNFTAETSGTNNGARFNMKTATRNWFVGTSQGLNGDQFYIGEGDSLTAGQRMVITTGGTFGFGTINPHLGYRADFVGGVRSTDTASTQFVAETMGGTNSWARYYMRSVNENGTLNQSWFIGTSRDFNGNQLYIGDETNNQTRFSIQPNGGPINMQGRVTQDVGGHGLPKALIKVNGNGAILNCYNGISGSTTGGCGFTVSRPVQGNYTITLGFDVNSRFVVVSVQDNLISLIPVSIAYQPSGTSLSVTVFETHESGATIDYTDRPFTVAIF